MERSELLKKIKRRACSLIRSDSIITAVDYRNLSFMSDKKAIRMGTKMIMERIIKSL